MENIKDIIAKKLLYLRQKNNFTQSELAEKLNYTDKSISKWEHGESTPPIEVLKAVADIYGDPLDYLVNESLEANYDRRYNYKENRANKLLITLLAVSTVWIIATVLFVYNSLLTGTSLWILFVLALPVSCIVLLVFNCIWGKRLFTFIIISVLIWSILATLYLVFLEYNIWSVFIIGVPLQIATFLWALLKTNKKLR